MHDPRPADADADPSEKEKSLGATGYHPNRETRTQVCLHGRSLQPIDVLGKQTPGAELARKKRGPGVDEEVGGRCFVEKANWPELISFWSR